MSSAAPTDDRIRQIATLVSIVDASAARQLLLHLPTETAKRVRTVAATLGPVSAEEERKILAAFQQSASNQNSQPKREPLPGVRLPSDAISRVSVHSPIAHPIDNRRELESDEDVDNYGRDTFAAEHSRLPWTRLGTDALVSFVSGERPAVIAVVVSQLPTKKAVDVLTKLGTELSCEVMKKLSRLQDIDPEAKLAIDEHLAERLGEQRERIETEIENSKRVHALMLEAPAELMQQWQDALSERSPSPSERPNIKVTPLPMDSQQSFNPAMAAIAPPAPSLADLYGNAAITTADLPVTQSSQESLNLPQGFHRDQASQSTDMGKHATRRDTTSPSAAETTHILPFPGSGHAEKVVDRSLIQIEFERILDLPPHALATLLSSADSETVLLALAGASQTFIRRLYGMLERSDAKSLQRRLAQIGAHQIRDIDEAQRQLVELAETINSQRFTGGPLVQPRAA